MSYTGIAGAVFTALVLLLVVRQFTWKADPWPEGSLQPPTYQGHRGYWKGGQQENTLLSFQAAHTRGLKMIELDVRLSRDGVVVVFHDGDLKRIGNSDKAVLDLTAAELQSIVKAPRLEDVLNDANSPHWVNIETKTGSVFDGSLEKAVAEVVRATHAEKRILFSSFNPLSIYRLSKLLPEVPRALLVSQEPAEGNRFYLRHMLFAPYIHMNALHLDYRYVTPEDVKAWKDRGVPVALWTVNEPEKAEAYLKAGALSIISDTLGEQKSTSL